MKLSMRNYIALTTAGTLILSAYSQNMFAKDQSSGKATSVTIKTNTTAAKEKVAVADRKQTRLAAITKTSATKTAVTASTVSWNNAFDYLGCDPRTKLAEYKLKANGLKVLICENHASPVVTSMVVYHVGSRNEAVGYTGSTHFLEHMMFKGTAKHDPLKGTGIDDILKPSGALMNATTSCDRTNYFEVVPNKYFETCLQLEADRMRGALLRETDRRSEMTVVRNELERNENYAQNLLDIGVMSTAFREHPYHHPTIGWRSDVESVPTARLRQFYNDFYYPDNASLIIIGDVSTDAALSLVAQHFGKLPKAPKPLPPVYTQEPPQEGERRFTIQKGDELPKLMLGFHIPKATDKDTYPLEVLAALLGDEKRQCTRLYKALVNSGLAQAVSAYNGSMKDPGLFYISASANAGVSLHKIEQEIDQTIKNLAQTPIDKDELERAKTSVWKRLKLGAVDPIDMAMQLAESIAVADWRWWTNLEKNIKAVTADDVQAVAKKYLVKRNETAGFYLPLKENNEAAADKIATGSEPKEDTASSTTIKTAATETETKNTSHNNAVNTDIKNDNSGIDSLLLPTTNPTPAKRRLAAPEEKQQASVVAEHQHNRTGHTATKSSARSLHETSIAAQTIKKVLPNGLTLILMPIPGSGVVSVSTKFKAGDCFADEDQAMVPDLVSSMLTEGSRGLPKEVLSSELEKMGTAISFSTQTCWSGTDTDVVLEDFSRFLALLGKVIKEPEFSDKELARLKLAKEAEIKDAMTDTTQVAINKLCAALYQEKSVFYGMPFEQQLDQLKATSRQNLLDFYKKHYTPANCYLAIAGDISAETAELCVKEVLGDWQGEAAVKLPVNGGPTRKFKPGEKIVTFIAEKSSVDICLGKPIDISLNSPDFYAATLANAALGHDTIASRLAAIREKHGLTYGISSFIYDSSEALSPWLIQLSTNPENVDKAMSLVNSISAKYLQEGIRPAELQAEAERLSGEYVVAKQRTPRQLAESLTKYELLGLGAQFMDTYPKRLKSTTKLAVDKAIKKYFDPQTTVVSLAGSLKGKP